jgi:two-component system, response regulator
MVGLDFMGMMNEEMEIVLIEDDEDDAQRMLKFLRSNFTNKIRHLDDGAKAAEFLLFETDTIPKLILLDLFLPYMDGVELYEMIRLEPAKRNLSVMFLLASRESKEYLDSLGLKPDGYLIKPTRKNNVPARIE